MSLNVSLTPPHGTPSSSSAKLLGATVGGLPMTLYMHAVLPHLRLVSTTQHGQEGGTQGYTQHQKVGGLEHYTPGKSPTSEEAHGQNEVNTGVD